MFFSRKTLRIDVGLIGLSSSFLFAIILTATTTTRADVSSILSPCDVNSECPDHASCLHFVDRKQCACNEGYVAALSLRKCETAVHLNQPCITRCAGFFVVCDPGSKVCVCQMEYAPAADGKNCVEKGKGLLGEACDAGCVFNLEQVCVDGVCVCNSSLRPMTKKEIRAWNNPQRQCINSTYSTDSSTASFTPTSQINNAEPPSQVNHTEPPSQVNHTEPPSQANHTEPPSQVNHTETPDGNGANMRAPHTSEMTTGFAAGISTAVFLTLIAFVVVVVVVRRRKSRADDNNTNNKSPNVTEKGLSNSSDVTEPTVDGDRVTSLSSRATGALPDVLVHSTDIRSSTSLHGGTDHVTDEQDKSDSNDLNLSDEKIRSKLSSRDGPSVVYSNFKIKENKAKHAIMTKGQAEETPLEDSTYNTLSTANVKSRDNEPDHMDGYNTLYNMKT